MITTITMSLRLPLIAAYFQFDYDVFSPTVAGQPDKQGTYRHLLIRFHKGRSNPSRGCNQFRNSQQLLKWTNEKTIWQKDTHHLRDCWGLKLLWPFSDEMSPSSLCRFATDWNSAGSCFSMHRIHRILWMTEYAQNIQNTLNMIRQWVSVPV